MNKYSLVLLFSLFLFGCRSTKELNVSGFRIDLPFDKISLEPINDFGIFNYESEMKETMDNEVAIRPHYQIFIPMKGLKKIVETSTDWYFFYTHDRVIAIQQDLTKNNKASERIKSSDGLGIRRISEDSVYYYSFSSECNKKLKNKGLPHYSYVDGEIIILMLNIPDRDYKYFVEYPLNSFRIKRRGGVRHRHDVPLICIMPPQPPDDETIIEQPMPDDQLIEDEVPCDVTAIDYCGNFFYEDGTLRRILIPGGYVTFANNNVNQPEYHFYITDHQGNVRVVANQNGEVEQVNHYYPYGGLMGESTSSDAQPYKYNGKELDRHSGLDWYDYGARWYNGVSWMTPDPLAEKYYDISPYVYCANNPINAVDPDGKVVIPVHGTWTSSKTWENLKGIVEATNNIFGDRSIGKDLFNWSSGNYAKMRTEAAKQLIDFVRNELQNKNSSEPITLVAHSHGGNVSIEAINMMVEMDEFKDRQINLLTINTPVRKDYQLSKNAQERVNHVNVYDSKDPVQIWGGNDFVVLPDHPSDTKFTGEYGMAGRTFKTAKNIVVDNPQSIFSDYHNSHNRVQDWIKKAKEK